MTVIVSDLTRPTALAELEPDVEVLHLPNPFTYERVRVVAQEGETVAELVARLQFPRGVGAWVEIDGQRVSESLWARVKPRRGHRVTIRSVPAGGGGGDDNKTLRIVLLVVILIVAVVTTVLTWGALGPFWAVALGSGILAVGSFAVNMLLPPSIPNLGKLGGLDGATGRPQESATLSITGSRNRVNKFGPIPKIFGRHGCIPPIIGGRP